MNKLLDVIEGISQVLANSKDGGTEFGLMREKELSIYEPRVMDGFGVQFHGNMITVKYQTELPITAVHDKNFETDMRDIMKKIVSRIKEEFKSLKKSNLKLTEYGDLKVVVQTVNRLRVIVNTAQTFELTGVSEKDESNSKEVLSNVTKGWMANFSSK